MKVRDFLKQFDGYSEDMLDKEIEIECPNSILVPPSIKLRLVEEWDMLNHSIGNIASLVISHD